MNSINVKKDGDPNNPYRPTIDKATVTFGNIPGAPEECDKSTSVQKVLNGKTAIFKADARYCEVTS